MKIYAKYLRNSLVLGAIAPSAPLESIIVCLHMDLRSAHESKKNTLFIIKKRVALPFLLYNFPE